MKIFELKTAQSGAAAAKAVCIRKAEAENAFTSGRENEKKSLSNAVDKLKEELSAAAGKAAGDGRSIIEAEMMLLDDPAFTGEAFRMIDEKDIGAAEAVRAAAKALTAMFADNGDKYIQSRVDDINGLAGDILNILGGSEKERLNEPSIIVAAELSPTYFSCLDVSLIRGIVTVKGSAVSHLSILAGNYGIPYIYGSAEAVETIVSGDILVIDNGSLIIDPDEETYQKALSAAEAVKRESVINDACSTRICANAGSIADVEAAVRKGAAGIGLFRTELLFLERREEPSEKEQYELYLRLSQLAEGREIVIRTMDIGSDKTALWLPLADEKNPALGCRGVRVSLDNEAVFKKQLRALLRAAVQGNIRILIPMITSSWELDEVRRIMSDCERELADSGIPYKVPEVGVMIETPAAVMTAPMLAEKAAFFSIGTNDLTQYTLAVDRENEGLDRYYDPCHEAVFLMIGQVCRAAHDKHIPVTVCGELGGNEKALKRLLEAGIDELSVSVGRIEKTRAAAAAAEKEILREKNKNDTDIVAPADGKLVRMGDIPDPAFSSGSLGKCIGIIPESGSIYAPCSGRVTGIAEAKHAITIETQNGESILVHVGIDTVSLGGKGFEPRIAVGDTVTAGQLIMEADLGIITAAGLSSMVIVVKCK